MDLNVVIVFLVVASIKEETTGFPFKVTELELFDKRNVVEVDPTSVEAADSPGAVEGDIMMNPTQKDIYEHHLIDTNDVLDEDNPIAPNDILDEAPNNVLGEDRPIAPNDVLGTNDIIEKRKAINVGRYDTWPDGIIPYYFNTLLPEMQPRVEYAMKTWEEKTCLHFVPYPSNETNHSGRVEFNEGSGCWSNMAFTGGLQKVSLEKVNCNSLSVILHEIGHTIGLFHEQSRPDRDKYIKIHLENVKDGMLHNFKMRDFTETNIHNMPYDVSSVMHYGPKAFSKDGSITLESMDPGKQQSMGKQQLLTFLDHKIVNEMYGCSQNCSNKPECMYGGYVGSDCQCICPRGLGGYRCEKVVSQSDCGGKFMESSGLISTPNYPNKYENNLECNWLIEAPIGYRVIMTFEDFELESARSCAFDRVQVRTDQPYYDGYPPRYCGVTLKGETLESLHNTMFIEFTSDYSVTRAGFVASYKFIPAA